MYFKSMRLKDAIPTLTQSSHLETTGSLKLRQWVKISILKYPRQREILEYFWEEL